MFLQRSIDEEHVKILQKYQMADETLYRHFRAKLETRIEDFGKERMEEAVKEVERLNKLVYDQCVIGERTKIIMDAEMKELVVK